MPAGAVSRALAFGEVFRQIECRFRLIVGVIQYRTGHRAISAPESTGNASTPKTGIDDLLCAFRPLPLIMHRIVIHAITTSILLAFGPNSRASILSFACAVHPTCGGV